MADIIQSSVSNRLLSLMKKEYFELIAAKLSYVDLPRRFVLSNVNVSSEYCYFPESGLGSIVAVSPEGERAEVGIFGKDGMTPTALVMDGGSTPHEIFMQVAGKGHRIESAAIIIAFEFSSEFRKLLTRYAQSMAIQTSYTALSNAVHNVEERLARWILMCHDRCEGNEVPLTHEFLSIMLSVRRSSVTTALHVLESNKFISTERGVITVRDRSAMEVFANDAYGLAEAEYDRLIGRLH